MTKDKLKVFEAIFNPQSIAIVGASRDRKVGGLAVHYLLLSGYKGKIFPVNPREETISELTAYPGVGEIPEPVDYVIVMVPAKMVPAIINDCIAKSACIGGCHCRYDHDRRRRKNRER